MVSGSVSDGAEAEEKVSRAKQVACIHGEQLNNHSVPVRLESKIDQTALSVVPFLDIIDTAYHVLKVQRLRGDEHADVSHAH
jgi:hypothetical protein